MGNLKMEKGMVKGSKFGMISLCTKATGAKIKRTAREGLSMLMAMYIKEIGRMIKHMVMGFIITLTVQATQVSGWRMSTTAMAYKNGSMAQFITGNLIFTQKS